MTVCDEVLRRGLMDALAGVDAANAECPIRNGDRRQAMRPRCIKCGADDNQNCGPELTALSKLEKAARALTQAPREGGA